MNNEVLHLHVNNSICEAVGCFEKATTKTKVKVGNLGSISIDLCGDCTRKFDQNGNNKGYFRNADVKQKTARNDNHKKRHMEAIEAG